MECAEKIDGLFSGAFTTDTIKAIAAIICAHYPQPPLFAIRQAKEALVSANKDFALIARLADGTQAANTAYQAYQSSKAALTALNSLLAGDGHTKRGEVCNCQQRPTHYKGTMPCPNHPASLPPLSEPTEFAEHLEAQKRAGGPEALAMQPWLDQSRLAVLRQASEPTDKEMLDWLAEQIGPGYAGGIVTVANLIPEFGGDFRSAIRAAMSRTQEKGVFQS
jgi:hypothetical protein